MHEDWAEATGMKCQMHSNLGLLQIPETNAYSYTRVDTVRQFCAKEDGKRKVNEGRIEQKR